MKICFVYCYVFPEVTMVDAKEDIFQSAASEDL